MKTKKTIAIIGGGVRGGLTAYRLIRRGARAKVILIDPTQTLASVWLTQRQAISTCLNVPAGKISALPDQPSRELSLS